MKFTKKELEIVGNAVDSAYKNQLEKLLPIWEEVKEEEGVIAPNNLLDSLNFNFGYRVKEISAENYPYLCRLVSLADTLEDFKYLKGKELEISKTYMEIITYKPGVTPYVRKEVRNIAENAVKSKNILFHWDWDTVRWAMKKEYDFLLQDLDKYYSEELIKDDRFNMSLW